MITSEYVAMRFDQTEGWNCVVDSPQDVSGLKDHTRTFDFGTGARFIGLVPADISLLGEPREIRIPLPGITHGHPLCLQMVPHLMTFERTRGRLEGDGPHEIVMPTPSAEGWRGSGGESRQEPFDSCRRNRSRSNSLPFAATRPSRLPWPPSSTVVCIAGSSYRSPLRTPTLTGESFTFGPRRSTATPGSRRQGGTVSCRSARPCWDS